MHVEIDLDGERLRCRAGESIAAALLRSGQFVLRHSPRSGLPRGAFCFMGSCQECVVEVDGVRAAACQTPVAQGMKVRLGVMQGERA